MASETRSTSSPQRRFYCPELKLQVMGACAQPEASIAGVALQHGINANVVRRWQREHSAGTLINMPLILSTSTEATEPQPTGDIRVEVRRANVTIVVHWSLASGAACAQWLSECLL
jgi:transposase